MPSRVISWGRTVFDPAAVEGDAAVGDASVVDAEETGNGAQRRRFAGTVGAEDGDDLSTPHVEADALNRGDGAVIDDFELLDLKQWRIAHLRPPPTGRYLNGHSRK
jgi:hypothetical protein